MVPQINRKLAALGACPNNLADLNTTDAQLEPDRKFDRETVLQIFANSLPGKHKEAFERYLKRVNSKVEGQRLIHDHHEMPAAASSNDQRV